MSKQKERNRTSLIHRLSTQQSKLIEVERNFEASVELLFAAFTSPESIQAWWWPEGVVADRVRMEFREGGSYFIGMKRSDQIEGGMTGIFQEIEDNSRIVMTDHFADKNGQATTAAEAGVPGVWPETVYITFEFAGDDERSCRLHFFQEGVPNDMYEECRNSWYEMFNKLEKFLTSHPKV